MARTHADNARLYAQKANAAADKAQAHYRKWQDLRKHIRDKYSVDLSTLCLCALGAAAELKAEMDRAKAKATEWAKQEKVLDGLGRHYRL